MLIIGHPLELLSEIESTNNYIANHPRLADMSEGTAILTYHQTQGRGQRQREWQMVKDKDLAVSYLFRPRISPEKAFTFNKLIALAVRDCISTFVSGDTTIKWPNDIYVDGKKVAGILIEPSWQGQLCKNMVTGIGVNVNSDIDRSAWNALSLFQIGGFQIPLLELFERLCRSLTKEYKRLSTDTESSISMEFDSFLLGFESEVAVNSQNSERRAQILGVDSRGQLRIAIDGKMTSHQHGTIKVDYSNIR